MNLVQTAETTENQAITRELWETAPSAEVMLTTLAEPAAFRRAGVADIDQQLRLFAAWCARRTSHLLADQRSRRAIQAAELFATGSAPVEEIERAYAEACAAVRSVATVYGEPGTGACARLPPDDEGAADAAQPVDRELAFGCALLHAAYTAAQATAHSIGTTGGIRAASKCSETARTTLYWEMVSEGADVAIVTEKLEEEHRRQAEALRTFIGNPFDHARMPPMAVSRRAACAGAPRRDLLRRAS